MAIVLTDLTNESGTGSFDVLMDAVNDHLTTQFESNRITGSDYATVYLGAMQVAMQEAIHILDVSQQAAVADTQSAADLALKTQQAALIEEQAVSQQKQQDLLDEQILAEAAGKLKIDAETALLAQKKITEVAETTTPSSGIKLAEYNLNVAQANGFKAKQAIDAVQQLANMWNVWMTSESEDDFIDTIKDLNNGTIMEKIQGVFDNSGITAAEPSEVS